MNLRNFIEVAVLAGAAFLEVGGDVLIRRGLRGGGVGLVALGFFVLGTYGVLVTLLELDFSRVMGAYLGFFALTTLLFSWLVFRERINSTTWVGVTVVLVGSLIIQFGPKPAVGPRADELRTGDRSRTQ